MAVPKLTAMEKRVLELLKSEMSYAGYMQQDGYRYMGTDAIQRLMFLVNDGHLRVAKKTGK